MITMSDKQWQLDGDGDREKGEKIYRKYRQILSIKQYSECCMYLSLSFLVPLLSDGGLFSAEISKALDRIYCK